ncbi:MAG TPA: SH3 domain-containing protein [Spirochaetia bacterium]|nr:SH3 domain-containing protein [Spirochaetia bacterium]
MKHHKSILGNFILFCVTTGVLTTLLTGCGPRTIGYGLVLWSDNESLIPTGAVVAVVDQSRITNTYSVVPPPGKNKNSNGAKSVDVDQWRVSFFADRKAADAYQKEFSPYMKVYARSEKNALPIRSEASPSADMVYKLRQGEVMKVLRKSATPSTESGLEAYWYNVLTKSGVSGWVFGYLLTVYDQGSGMAAPLPAAITDPTLATIMSNTWRPSYFGQMINSGIYDLSRFQSRYGFFPDPEQKRFNLVRPEYSVAFPYSDIQKMELNRYAVQGTSLLMTLRGETDLILQYSHKGNITSTTVEKIDQNVDDLIKAEQQRRDDLYSSFLNHGDLLTSSAYGEIRLSKDKSFSWDGFQPLVPNVIPRTATGSGSVDFSLYLDSSLTGKYDGVITFNLNGTDRSQSASFLYSFASGGVRFVYVPESTVKDGIVQRVSISPVIIFFSPRHAGG